MKHQSNEKKTLIAALWASLAIFSASAEIQSSLAVLTDGFEPYEEVATNSIGECTFALNGNNVDGDSAVVIGEQGIYIGLSRPLTNLTVVVGCEGLSVYDSPRTMFSMAATTDGSSCDAEYVDRIGINLNPDSSVQGVWDGNEYSGKQGAVSRDGAMAYFVFHYDRVSQESDDAHGMVAYCIKNGRRSRIYWDKKLRASGEFIVGFMIGGAFGDQWGACTGLRIKSLQVYDGDAAGEIVDLGDSGSVDMPGYDEKDDGDLAFRYTVSADGEATIAGALNIPAEFTIPGSIDGYPVVGIGYKAFIKARQITQLTIPDSVRCIGKHAFMYCTGLESVSIGSGMRSIGNCAFYGCTSLRSVKLANGVESIGIAVFQDCHALETIALPISVTSLDWQVFKNCPSLQTVYMHSSLKGLKNKAWFENTPDAAIQYYNCQTPAAPPQVEWIEATEDYEGVIEVRWDLGANAEVSGYRLYRAMRPHFRFADMIAEVPATGYGEGACYLDYDVSPQYTYCYWVVPVNDIFAGEVSGSATGYCDEVFAIATASLPTGKELEPYSQALTVSGGNVETLEWHADGLPPGLSIARPGIVSGVPTQAGTYTVRIGCHDSDWTMSAETELMIEIVENEDRKPEIRESTPADGSYLLLEPGANQAFSVSASDPDGKAVSYIWIVDGEEVGSGTDATSYAISTLGDEPGTRHDVACYVNDGPWANIVCCKWTVYLPRTLYVDAAGGSDEADGASKEGALSTIQSAIDRSANGDTIVVADGVYAPIATRNRKIVIQSENGYKNAIIDGGGEANCALLGGPESIVEGEPEAYGELWQGTNTVLRGFTLRNGHAAWGAGVTAGTVENCLIVSNTVEAYPWNSTGPNGLGGGAYLSVLRNCTIVGNTSSPAISDEGEVYGGIDGGSCACTLFNCIEWGNADDVEEGAVVNNEWWQASVYENCCRDNPLFADAVNNDYRPSPESPAVVDGAVVAGCEFEIAPSTIPELTENEAAAWVSSDLATRYAVSGEDAADYIGRFEAKFGDDAVAALSKTTGKKDAQGNDMYVWQDYVAGTDPTDTNSVFTATITMVDGEPVVEWSPKLSAEEEARRRYTIYGKAGLGAGEEWHSPTNALDRFFMVGVEMAD